MRLAAELVVTRHLDPDLALETARLNGADIPVSLATFTRQLRETRHQPRASARRGVRPYRRGKHRRQAKSSSSTSPA